MVASIGATPILYVPVVVDGAVVDGAAADGAVVDGALVDGAVVDGAVVDGALVDSLIVVTAGGSNIVRTISVNISPQMAAYGGAVSGSTYSRTERMFSICRLILPFSRS
jgi:hypothetical protein